MGETLKLEYPEVEQYARFYLEGPKLIKKGTEFISESKLAYADSTLFDVFTLPAVAGDPSISKSRLGVFQKLR